MAAAALRLTVLAPAVVPVTVFRVEKGRVEQSVTNSKAGTVKSRRRATLSSELGGRVIELPARKGLRVEKGDLLMRVFDADYRAQVAVAESALSAARASRTETCRTAELAETQLKRNRALAREELVSTDVLDQIQSQRDAAVAACEAAAARIQEAEASLQVARVNLAKTELRAPFAGIVADVTTELGEWITPSPPGLPIPPVIVLLDTGSNYISTPMDEVDVAKVRLGQPVRVTLDAFPGRSFAGRVTRIAPFVEDVQEQNRTFEIEAELDDRAFAQSLLPGTSADVEVILAARDGVLRIPSYALLEGGRVLVFRSGRLEARKVETGLQNWQYVEVRRGLDVGDPVVVSLDRAEVKEGARARIAAESAR
ncbi:MAG: efflux RND transporter periplasmic adaptor subunit [Syntrophomonadaceae bacterium]